MSEVSAADYRDRAIKEHGEACQACGRTQYVEVHHIDGDRSNNTVENLIPLCTACHRTVHDSTLTLDDVLSDEWPDGDLENESVRMSVTITRRVKLVIEELAEEANRPQARIAGELIEDGLADRDEGQEDSNTERESTDEYVERLEDEVEFLRSVVKDAV